MFYDIPLAAIPADPPDVLVSDIVMPDEDGHGLIRRVRAMAHRASTLPAAALTAYARPVDCERAIAAGFHLHLSNE